MASGEKCPLDELLESLSLREYKDALLESGVKDVDDLAQMSPEDIKMIATKPVHARKLTDLVSSCNSSASRSRAESNARDASEANGTASRGASSAKSRSSEGKAEPDARSASGSAASTPKKARGVHRPPTRTRAVARNKPATSNNQAPPQNHQEVVIDAHVQANSATRSEPEAVDIAQAAINSQISEAPQQSTEESRLESASSAPTNDDFISHVTNAEVIAEGRLSAEATPETTEIIAVEDVKSSRGASPEAASSRAHLDAKDDENAETNNLRRSPSTEAAASGSAATSKEATTPEERSEEGASLPIRVLDDSNEGGEELTSASAVPTSSDAIPPPPPPQPYLLPPKSEWPDFPVLLRMSPDAKANVWVNGAKVPWQAALPINDPTQIIEFETATFKGRCLVRLADLAPNPRAGGRSGSVLAEPYFSGRKRKMQVVVQGRFKRRLRFDQVFGGQEFSKPLKHVPAKRFIKFCFNILRSRLPEVIVSDLFGPHPYYYSPLVTGSKIVRVEAVGTSMDASKNALREVQQHPLVHVGAPLHEDFRHHGGSRYEPHDGFGAYDPVAANAEALAAHAEANPSAAAAVTKTTKKSDAKALKAKKKDAKAVDKVHSKRNAICVDQRQKMFGNLESLAQHSYDPRMEYTFEYYDANFRASDMKADLGGVAKLDLGYAIGEQPVLIDMAKTSDTGEYLYKFELWHERQLSDGSPAWASGP